MGRSKSYSTGGCRRTCVLPCGMKIQDKPERIQTKLDLHRKRCSVCQSKERFVSKDFKFEGDLNGTNLRGGMTYTEQNPMIMRGHKDGLVEGITMVGSQNGREMEAICKEVSGYTPPPSDERTNKQKKKSIMKAKKKHKDKFKDCLSEIKEGEDWIKVRDTIGCEEFKDPRPSEPIYKPDDFIIVQELPSMEEQLKNAIGDCVRSALYFMKRDEWAGYKDRLRLMTMIAPAFFEASGFVGGYYGEPVNVHHVLIDTKSGVLYEFSNNRLQRYECQDDYLEKIYPKPTTMKVGTNLSELRKKAQDYAGVSDEQMNDGITYMFLELTHSKMCYNVGENKEFYKDSDNRINKDRSYANCKEMYKVMVEASKLGRVNEEIFWEEFVEAWMEDGRTLF